MIENHQKDYLYKKQQHPVQSIAKLTSKQVYFLDYQFNNKTTWSIIRKLEYQSIDQVHSKLSKLLKLKKVDELHAYLIKS